MRTLTLSSLFLFLTVSLFISCGSDNPVTNNPNPPSNPVNDTVTLLTKDSIWFTQINYQDSGTLSYLTTIQIDTLYIDFDFRTSGIRSLAILKINSDTLVKYSNFSASTFDTNFRIIQPVNLINFITNLSIKYDGGFYTGTQYGALRNIKLWYIKRS